MKRCAYCGQKYPDEVTVCAIDQEPLQGNDSPTSQRPSSADGSQKSDLIALAQRLKNFTRPVVVTGLLVTIFAVFVLLDALMSLAWVEAAIGGVLGACGWLLLRSGFSGKPRRLTWLRFLMMALPSLPMFYVLGYFALMDRSQPTDPAAEKHFQSSLRWMPYSRGWGERRPYHDVTIFNILFSPADKIYFKWFPRTDEELQRLKALGYFQ